MSTLLQIDSSPRTDSISSKLSAAFVERWKKQNPAGTVIHHNTSTEKLPYLDETILGAFFTPPEAQTAEQRQAMALSDKLVDELLAADVIVLGVPMWNFGIPASLKAWIDLIVRTGRTFSYTASGVQGLIPAGKKVYVFTARGGSYAPGSPFEGYDFQAPYLRGAFGFLGLKDVEFVHAENQTRAPEVAAEGLAKAEAAVAVLAV